MPAQNSWKVDKPYLLDDNGESPNVLLVKIVPKVAGGNIKAVIDDNGIADTCFTIVTGDDADAEGSDADSGITREKWSKSVEFLLSCVALSVGFGNVWKFPYTAMDNGGGAFLIPYLIVLFVVGRPLYYLEMVMGQFSSRGCVKVYDVSPLMRGVGVGQTITMFTIVGFYAAVLAIAVRYFVASFQSPLPWTECLQGWANCIESNSTIKQHFDNETVPKTVSAQYYFDKSVINIAPSLESDIGIPDWKLAICLLVCWILITALLIKGIKSSGKASYFLAIFPYVILTILLVRACTLEGAGVGIRYFFEPDFSALLKPKVWYEAVSQCFFSLTIGLGAVIVFSSYNSFSNNIYRDAMIISSLDTVNAIAKMTFAPNLFAVLFFLMFILLGLGSSMGIVQTILTSIQDRFPQVKTWQAVLVIGIAGFSCGLVYITPVGLFVLDFISFYGVTFATLTLVILEAITFCWIYGVNRICQDIKFMLGIETGLFWRICWGLVTPACIIAVFIMEMFAEKDFPTGYKVFGWYLFAFTTLVQIVWWGLYAMSKQTVKENEGRVAKMVKASQPTEDWGPEGTISKRDYDVAMRRYRETLDDGGNVVKRALRRIFQ